MLKIYSATIECMECLREFDAPGSERVSGPYAHDWEPDTNTCPACEGEGDCEGYDEEPCHGQAETRYIEGEGLVGDYCKACWEKVVQG